MTNTELKNKMNEDFDTISGIAEDTREKFEDILVSASMKLKSRYYFGDLSRDDYIALISETFSELRSNVNITHLEGLTASIEAIKTKLKNIDKETL